MCKNKVFQATDCLIASSQHLLMTYTYCCVYSAGLLMMERETVKNKFEKLVRLVGFIIRMYHDARSFECQIKGQV